MAKAKRARKGSEKRASTPKRRKAAPKAAPKARAKAPTKTAATRAKTAGTGSISISPTVRLALAERAKEQGITNWKTFAHAVLESAATQAQTRSTKRRAAGE